MHAVQKLKANGVIFRDSKGSRHMAYLNSEPKSEIILCAGAIGSPQLLMLSGIGPAQQLQAQGIKVILDQQMVGQGMADNPLNVILVPSARPVEISLVQTVGISDVGSYIEALSWIFLPKWAQNISRDSAQIKIGNQTILSFPSVNVGVIGEKVTGPYSTGYLELRSRDPSDNPKVTFNYFQDSRDLEICVEGMKIIRKVIESRSLSSFLYPLTSFESLVKLTVAIPSNLRKRHVKATYSTEQFCIDTVISIWHYHGGCQVDRVVDRNYKVLGVDSLRVVDGSTFYKSPGTNPQATVMMLGRYMGKKILGDQGVKSGYGETE